MFFYGLADELIKLATTAPVQRVDTSIPQKYGKISPMLRGTPKQPKPYKPEKVPIGERVRRRLNRSARRLEESFEPEPRKVTVPHSRRKRTVIDTREQARKLQKRYEDIRPYTYPRRADFEEGSAYTKKWSPERSSILNLGFKPRHADKVLKVHKKLLGKKGVPGTGSVYGIPNDVLKELGRGK